MIQLPATALEQLLTESSQAQPHHQVPLMIWGPPGIGKSDLVRQAAAATGRQLIDLRLSQLEPTDLRGIPLHVDGRVRWAPPEELPDAERDNPKGILFLDEINAAPPPVAAAAYQLILDRRLGHYRLPDDWLIIAAGNRLGDRGITYAMPAPLANRFMHAELVADATAWIAWASRNAIDERLIDFIASEPQWLSRFDPDSEQTVFPSPRSWVFAHRILTRRADLGAETLAQVAGCVGEAAARALGDYHRGSGQLDGWLQDPASLATVDTLDRQIAISQQIRTAVAEGRIDAGQALQLTRHLQDERLAFGLIEQLHQDLGDRLFDEPEFAHWVASYQGGIPAGAERSEPTNHG